MMFKKTYGFTFLVVLGVAFLTGPQVASIANESATAPIVHVAHGAGGVLM
jgi:hypothetical protein